MRAVPQKKHFDLTAAAIRCSSGAGSIRLKPGRIPGCFAVIVKSGRWRKPEKVSGRAEARLFEKFGGYGKTISPVCIEWNFFRSWCKIRADGGGQMEKFCFTTKTDYEVFRDYWMFTLLQKRSAGGKKSGFLKYMTALAAVVGAAGVLCVCNAFALENALGVFPLFLLLGVGAAFVSALATALYVQPKGQYKLVREAVESPQKYRFTEEQMEVRESIPEENRESLAEFPYGSIVCGWETRKAFYLFISETEAFLIPKDQLADSSGFSAFLARKLEERYFRQKN